MKQLLKDAWAALVAAQERRAQAQMLRRLDARTLQDIGLESSNPDGFAPAHAAIAWSQAEDLFFCYAIHDPDDIIGRARRAVALDDRDALSHLALPRFRRSLSRTLARRASQDGPCVAACGKHVLSEPRFLPAGCSR